MGAAVVGIEWMAEVGAVVMVGRRSCSFFRLKASLETLVDQEMNSFYCLDEFVGRYLLQKGGSNSWYRKQEWMNE
jgi:hypothetical protein